MDLAQTAAAGDRLATLRALRDVLASRVDERGPDMAACSARLVDVLTEIDRLDPPAQKGTALDEFTQRRAARGADTARPARAGRGQQR